ncbi:MAG TPA: hypothetical protein ENH85_12030 [Candidatus Scalindua sp.]|nr:hypothetical protein [Candidatus Scalindua sp.]
MTQLIGLTILEQVRLLTPYFIYGGIMFLLLGINTLLVTYFNRREWRRLEEKRLPETVRRKLADRDRTNRSLRYQIDKQDEVIEWFSVTIRAAAMHNHKVAEILQLPQPSPIRIIKENGVEG